jgi:hypothetical protein
MQKNADIIKQITQLESALGVYDIRIHGFSFWRIVRAPLLDRYMKSNHGQNPRDTSKKTVYPFKFFVSYLASFMAYLSLLFTKKRHVKYIVYAFPRLQKIDGRYIDKFTDPLIASSNLKDNCIIFQRPLAGLHKKPRYNQNKIVTTDFVDFSAGFAGLVLLPFILLIYGHKLYKLYLKAKQDFGLTIKDYIKFNYRLGAFLFSYAFNKHLLKLLKPRKVLLVNRGVNYAVIHACKKLQIDVCELQHGITHSYTILYSGKYDNKLDPDYLYSFGAYWKGKQFGLPHKKIINIGWAFENFLKEITPKCNRPEDVILVISEPIISDNIIRAVGKLAKQFSHITFDLRLHPQECFSALHAETIKTQTNIKLVDNTTESSVAVMAYKRVIGVNSSVLYEALGLNKAVGCINFEGCNAAVAFKNIHEIFTIISCTEDLQDFLLLPAEAKNKHNAFFSHYNADFFNKILNEQTVF